MKTLITRCYRSPPKWFQSKSQSRVHEEHALKVCCFNHKVNDSSDIWCYHLWLSSYEGYMCSMKVRKKLPPCPKIFSFCCHMNLYIIVYVIWPGPSFYQFYSKVQILRFNCIHASPPSICPALKAKIALYIYQKKNCLLVPKYFSSAVTWICI